MGTGGDDDRRGCGRRLKGDTNLKGRLKET